jgi:branched-chain amino acid transport system permease protein
MNTALEEIKKSLLTAVWLMFLTFPIMVIKVNTIYKIVEWRWERMFVVGVAAFFASFLWRFFMRRKEMGVRQAEVEGQQKLTFLQKLLQNRRFTIPAICAIAVFAAAYPFIFSMYQTNIMITALIYVVIGLGLNIVVGLAGLLDLGYVAFYAVGAYAYGLINYHFGLGFWTVLPVGAALAALFGILLGFPVLRLRGDYLAIVTLGFGEIIRLILENWNAFSFGPSGIANIPRPSFFGMPLSLQKSTIYMYFIMIGLSLFTVFVVHRLENSRLGRAWVALREDEVACQAMGIDKTKTKLTAFALGATWAGMGGVVLPPRQHLLIRPASPSGNRSSSSVCGARRHGLNRGVICGAMVLILLPEYLRAFSEYRMLAFGAVLVIMMVFRPGGIVTDVRRTYKFEEKQAQAA